ncbi:MAG: guanylate kinase [Clostridiales bacterium]|nr:guanylate kinase [Clostridiales bacterium]
MQDKGLIVAISGPSGVGKGTVAAAVEAKLDGIRDVAHSISVTTRAPRGTEQDGVEYYFRSREEFEDLIAAGEIIEYDEYLGNYYGTPAKPLARMAEEGKIVLLDITIEGSLALKEYFGDDAVTIFITPPSMEELRRRLEGRNTEAGDVIARRLKEAETEIMRAEEFEYILENNDVDETSDEILKIINKESR